jgi:ribosome-associated toxin RatA of RatAB toxin-antitoxin module
MKNSLIFIPDISGFTEFTATTEINHSAHIVADLLEIILSKNKIGMQLSEIEGDALLFVKKDNVPVVSEIVEQAQEMYQAFHSHLIRYKESRVCDCGACTSAPGLTLKFFVHQGELVELKVGKLTKYHGAGMIIAHRLMKNNIDSHDYLLFSDSFKEVPSNQFTSDSIEFPVLGKVGYHFLDLIELKNNLKLEREIFEPIVDGISVKPSTLVINASMKEIFKDLGDLTVKEQILSSIATVKRTNQSMNYVGNEHVCVVNGKKLQVFTSGVSKEGDVRELVEETRNAPFMNKVQRTYRLERVDENKTKITIDSAFSMKSKLVAKILQSTVKKKFTEANETELQLMKKFYENRPKS